MINICGCPVEVTLGLSVHTDGHKGQWNSWINQIKIARDEELSEETRKETLLHEIIEAINSMHEYNLEHRTITSLSRNLFQVLKDNNIWNPEFKLEDII